MKKTTPYRQLLLLICLTAYVFGICKPLMTYAAYTVNVDYISTALCVQKNETDNCCKGKCYLNNQLKKEAKEESQQKIPSVKTMQEEMVADCLHLFVPQYSSRIEFAANESRLVTLSKRIAVPPPQAMI